MATIHDVYKGLQDIGTAITHKGGTVETVNSNPSLEELRVGVLSIPTQQIVLNEPASNISNIIVAEKGNVTISAKNLQGVVVASATTTTVIGGAVFLPITAIGNYIITATLNGDELWEKTVGVTSLGINITCRPGRSASEFTFADFKNAVLNGCSQYLFVKGDYFTFTAENSIFNNHELFINEIDDDGSIYLCLKKAYTGATYPMNNAFTYLASASSTSFTNTYSSAGGYKYTDLRQKHMKAGDDVWIQATGIKPTGSTISTGIEFDKIYYTNGNGETSGVYTYNPETDTFTEDSEFTYHSSSSNAQKNVKFLHGYFTSVGKIASAETFNAGYYYTRTGSASNGFTYTRATSYSSSTTYYGFYKTLQANGIFYEGFISVMEYLSPIEMTASAGLAQTTYLNSFSDYVEMMCVENLTGMNRSSQAFAGLSYSNSNHYNIAGEGSHRSGFDRYDKLFCASSYWLRSVYSDVDYAFCYAGNNGSVTSYNVIHAFAVRPGIKISPVAS